MSLSWWASPRVTDPYTRIFETPWRAADSRRCGRNSRSSSNVGGSLNRRAVVMPPILCRYVLFSRSVDRTRRPSKKNVVAVRTFESALSVGSSADTSNTKVVPA